MKWSPHKYQQRAIKFCIERPNAGLLLDPGLGKSSIALAVYKILKSQSFVKSLLVIAPLRAVYSVWPAEVKKWDEFSRMSVGILHGPDKDKTLKEKKDIYVINPEGLEWLLDNIKYLQADMLVCDESYKFKNTRTQRFKKLKVMLPKFKRRYILTGSPVASSLLDIFGQLYVMDMGKTFGKSFSHFRDEYFLSVGYGGYTWVLKDGADTKIMNAVAPKVIRMSAKDYLELPELIIRDVFVDLPDKAMRIYKQMETILRVDFENDTVTAANAAVASMKCRQIANGGVFTNFDTTAWEDIHSAKSEATGDLVEELSGQPALISYDFKHDLDRIKQVLGKDTPHIGGGVSVSRGKELEEAWNRGELKCLLGHPQSIAHALNLQGAGGAVILHSLPWSLDLYEQFIRRIWRQGAKKRVVVHRIIARKTIDEVIIRSLETKGYNQNTFFKFLKAYLRV